MPRVHLQQAHHLCDNRPRLRLQRRLTLLRPRFCRQPVPLLHLLLPLLRPLNQEIDPGALLVRASVVDRVEPRPQHVQVVRTQTHYRVRLNRAIITVASATACSTVSKRARPKQSTARSRAITAYRVKKQKGKETCLRLDSSQRPIKPMLHPIHRPSDRIQRRRMPAPMVNKPQSIYSIQRPRRIQVSHAPVPICRVPRDQQKRPRCHHPQ